MPEDAAADPPPATPPVAGDSVVFGHFHVPRRADGSLWELGRGAMGVTYRAFDTGLRVEVALKVIAADKVADANTRARFQREARAAAKIRHPNVASVLHLGEQGGEFFYAMEFIAGRSLAALLHETAGPLPPAVAVALAAQVAAGLNAAHKKEVLHRDLKPANLMVLEGDALDHEDERTEAAGNRQVKVIDFGLARRFGAGRQEDSFVTQSIVGFIGTPAYASPEQAGGDGELDGRSDLYALGVILWEMLTGRLPFTGNPMVMLSRHLASAPPFEALAGLPPVLVELLTGLMEKEPAKRRPQSAAELRGLLDETLRALSPGGARAVVPAAGEGDTPSEGRGADGTAPSRVPTPTTTLIEPGTVLLDRYRLGREVGHGDGGRLFLAADNLDDDRPLALKLLPPERVVAEPGFLAAVQAALDGVNQHPHPVLLAHGEALQCTVDTAFYMREWAEGFSLLELLRGRGALRAVEVFRLLETLPDALDHLAAAAHADAFPWLKIALPKLFVAPPAPGASLPHPDWPGLRSRPVEGWPDFELRLNPLGFPPAAGVPTDVTRVGGPDQPEEPAVALARLVRELLGASADGTGPLSALKAEGNAVVARGMVAGAYADARAFWSALRGASESSGWPPLEETPRQEPLEGVRYIRVTEPEPIAIPEGRPTRRGMPVWVWVTLVAVCSVLAGGLWSRGGRQPTAPASASAPTVTVTPEPIPIPTAPSIPTPLSPAPSSSAAETLTPTPTSVPIAPPAPTPIPIPTPTPRPILTPTPGPTPSQLVRETVRVGRVAGERLVVNLAPGVPMAFRWCPAGSFTMGSPAGEKTTLKAAGAPESFYANEVPHRVALSQGFWMAETEVTQSQWRSLMQTDLVEQANKALADDTLYSFEGKPQTLRDFWRRQKGAGAQIIGVRAESVPIYYVNWIEAQEFCTRAARALASQAPGLMPRLPTEAQWEYACRAGTATMSYVGDFAIKGERNAPGLDTIAWYGGNSSVAYKGTGWDTLGWKEKQYPGGQAGPREVGTKRANGFGLSDTIGNVWEWCEDWYGDYPMASVTDPKGPPAGAERVLRGGSWNDFARNGRAAFRLGNVPGNRGNYLGFRLALVPSGE